MSNNKVCGFCKYNNQDPVTKKYICQNSKSERYNTSPASFQTCEAFSKENAHTMNELYQMQSLPLNAKIEMTKQRIRDWVNEFGEDGVYLSFSGGKDSTVLGHIIRDVCGYKNIPFVFVDVPTQYPELKQFAQTFDNLVILKPKISFAQVCEKYGFPMFSKEISECVEDSRKYIRILTDRQRFRLLIA
nr:MAG TPA: phosphoadenosine-phosphosulfate reductase [Caudoviricetes sp.]